MKKIKNTSKTENTDTTSGKKVIAMYRVSTERQDLTRQQEKIRRALTFDGYTDDQIIEIGNKESGVLLTAAEREGIQEMERHIEEGNIAAVYVEELSRLSRRAADTFAVRDYLLKHKVQLVCLNPNIKCFTSNWQIDGMANIVFGVMASMAENEGTIRKERCSSGKATSKAAGNLTHKPKFGYSKEMNGRRYKAVINEEQAALIRRIYHMYIFDGMPANAIGQQLKAEGIIKYKGNRGNSYFVWRILNDANYTGSVEYPAIVTKDEYEQAQTRLKESHKEIRYQYDNNLIWYGKGIMYHNNLKMHITNRDGAYKSTDDNGTLNINVVDSLLLWLADKFQTEFEIEKDEMKEVLRNRIEEYRKQLNVVESDRERVRKSIKKVNNQYDADTLTETEWREKIMTIKADEREINNREHHILTSIEDCETELTNREQPNKWVDVYALSDSRRVEVIRQIVKRVDVQRGDKQGRYYFHITLSSGREVDIFSETLKHKYYMMTEPTTTFDTTTKANEDYRGVCERLEDGTIAAPYFPRQCKEFMVPWVVRLDSKSKRLRQKKMQALREAV